MTEIGPSAANLEGTFSAFSQGQGFPLVFSIQLSRTV
jgi:hypothetical protein